jgi:4-aminobutyrate aminotransferase-like enzyme
MDAIAPGGLGGTYAGSPIACAAALAVMEVFEEEHLLDRCKAVGERLVTGLKAIQKKYPVIGEVRALGAMIAVELFENGDSHKPNAAAVAQVVAKARDKGLILRQRPAGAGAADRAGRATGQRPGDHRRVLLRTLIFTSSELCTDPQKTRFGGFF